MPLPAVLQCLGAVKGVNEQCTAFHAHQICLCVVPEQPPLLSGMAIFGVFAAIAVLGVGAFLLCYCKKHCPNGCRYGTAFRLRFHWLSSLKTVPFAGGAAGRRRCRRGSPPWPHPRRSR